MYFVRITRARVVDQDVHRAEFLHRAVDEHLPVGGARDVRFDEVDRLRVGGRDAFAARAVDVADQDLAALGREAVGDAFAEAGSAACR